MAEYSHGSHTVYDIKYHLEMSKNKIANQDLKCHIKGHDKSGYSSTGNAHYNNATNVE
jgi:hypothetical protein